MKVKTLVQIEKELLDKSNLPESDKKNLIADTYTLSMLYCWTSLMIESFTEEEREKFRFYLGFMYNEEDSK